MKNRIYAIAAVLAIPIASSCSHHQDFIQSTDEAVEVSFNLSVDGKTSTRAISDGTGVDQLTYAVFNDQGEIVVAKNVEDAPVLIAGAGLLPNELLNKLKYFY